MFCDLEQLVVALVVGELRADIVECAFGDTFLEEPTELFGELCAEILCLTGLDPLGERRQRRPGDAQRGLSGVELCAVLNLADEVVVLMVARLRAPLVSLNPSVERVPSVIDE